MATDSNLVGLFRGAAIGTALSTQIGTGAAEGEDINQSIRKAYLQAGVATGTIKPASLSPQDTNLLSNTLVSGFKVPTVKPVAQGGGGLLSTIESPFKTVGKVVGNTASDFAGALEGLPTGLETLGKAAYKTAQETVPFAHSEISGPDLGGVAKGIAQSTVHDFTHFDPMHPLYPALDVASVVSGGAGLLAKTGSALSRVTAATRALEEGDEASKLAASVGKLVPQKLGDFGAKVSKSIAGLERPPIPIRAAAAEGVNIPELPLRNYSISPIRRLLIEKPIEAMFQTKPFTTDLPGVVGNKSLADLRANYHIRKATNVIRGRASAESVARTVEASHPFNDAMQTMIDNSPNDTVAGEKFNALALIRLLGAENMTPEQRLSMLDEYGNTVLGSKGFGSAQHAIALETAEAKQFRDFYRQQIADPTFRDYFANPTNDMWRVRDAWDQSILEGLKSLNLDPHELLNRSLGPAAFVRDQTPEEVLRDQPEHIQRSMNFALQSHDIEQALRKSNGEEVPELANIPEAAHHLPGEGPLQDKIKLVQDAVDSLRADMAGQNTPRELLNNARSTGYLPGNTLAQKVAAELPARLGVPENVAEPFASGGLTNYFPQVSALHNMKIRPNGGRMAVATNALIRKPLSKLTHGIVKEGDVAKGMHEFKRENMARLLKANSIGVEPFSSFLKEADLSAFKAGVDRRDPIVFTRHIAQREKLLAHRLVAEPFVQKMALKDADGSPLLFANEQELQNAMGSVQEANKWRLIQPQAIQALVQGEDQAALDVAKALKDEGGMSDALSDHIDNIVSESGLAFVRQLADTVIDTKDKQIAVPTTYVDNLIKHAKIMDSGNNVGHMWQAFINKWRHAVLAYMPSWLLRTSIGHGVILFISGVWNPAHYLKAMQYFGDGFKVPFTDRLANRDDHVRLFRGEGKHVPAGVDQGSPHSDFGHIGYKMAVKNPVPTAITGAVHRVANFQRRAAFLSTLNRVTKNHLGELRESFDLPHGLLNSTNLDKVIAEHPDWVHHSLNELDKVSYTFGQMSPWERRLAKNILPFWGWYKFMSKFVWALPMTYPGRSLALARIGQIGQSNTDQLGPLPDWLRGSIMYDTHNLGMVHYISTLGLNPLGDEMNPFQGLQGIVRFGQMSPIIQAGLEGMGYNTMTGGLENIDPSSGIVEVNGVFVNTATGKGYDNLDQASVGASLDRFWGGLARAFPEIRIGEIAATGGHSVYPESIPFLSEHPIPPSSPASVKNVGPINLLEQYSGVAPKTYNVQKYQQNLLKDIRRGISEQRKAVVKEKAIK